MIVQEVESNVCICVVDLHCISLFALIIVANIAYEPHYLYIESATSFACKCLCFFLKKQKLNRVPEMQGFHRCSYNWQE